MIIEKKKIFRFRLGFRQAILIAILLHLLLFMVPDVYKSLVPVIPAKPAYLPPNQKPKELKFRFVEVPNDKETPNPDAKFLSDKDRRAATPSPNPEAGAPPEPLSKGQTPEAMLSFPGKNVTQPQTRPDEGKEGSLKEAQTTDGKSLEKPGEKDWIRIETIDELKEKMLADQASKSKKTLSEEDLRKYFEFQDFGNQSSSLIQKGGIEFDTKGFDFGKWLRDFYYKVYSNWIIPLAFESFRRSGMLTLHFYVSRDGSVSGLELLDSSGMVSYDDAAMSAISRSDPFLRLPEGYPDDRMEVKCRFIYEWKPTSKRYDRWKWR
jgi:TonB family protein